jgi:hypothetical protein
MFGQYGRKVGIQKKQTGAAQMSQPGGPGC